MTPPARPPSQDRLLRTVLVMLPFAVLGWLVHLIDGDRATLIASALLAIGYAGAAGSVLARLGVRPNWLLGLVATLVVGWLNVAWHTANWWAGGGATWLSPLAAPVVVTVVGAALAVVLVTARLRAAGLVASVLTLAVVPLLVVWAAHDWGDRDEVEDLLHELEATELPPYLPDTDRLQLQWLQVETANAYRAPSIDYLLSNGRPYPDDVLFDAVLLPPDTDVCGGEDVSCTDVADDARRMVEVQRDVSYVLDLGDAVMVVSQVGPVTAEADWDAVLDELRHAETASYADLSQRHP